MLMCCDVVADVEKRCDRLLSLMGRSFCGFTRKKP